MTNLHIVSPAECRERWVPFHICSSLEAGLGAFEQLGLSTMARIDYVESSSGLGDPTLPPGDMLAVEKLWLDESTGVDGEELIGKVLAEPELLSKIRLHGIAQNNERLIVLARAATRWDVDAILYNFQKQPGHEAMECIFNISQRGIAAILCNISSEAEGDLLALVEKNNFRTELCRW